MGTKAALMSSGDMVTDYLTPCEHCGLMVATVVGNGERIPVEPRTLSPIDQIRLMAGMQVVFRHRDHISHISGCTERMVLKKRA